MLAQLAFALLLAGAPAREVRLVMGSTAEVQVRGLDEPAPALDAAFAALDRVDRSMSLWQPSELTRLNDSGHAALSPDLFAVLRLALEVGRASAGALDPTVEPLVRASGGLGGPARVPGRGERRALLRRIGLGRVHLDVERREVRLDPGTRLDLGAVAKGYAVDQALLALREGGASSGLVDAGGSSLASFGEPLQVAVRDPRGGPPCATFELQDAALGSSGGDQRPGHILDPRSGRPARRALASTVVAATGIEADALSTATFVLGPEAGLRLLQGRGGAGLVLREERGRLVLHGTPGFAARHRLRLAPGVVLREASR